MCGKTQIYPLTALGRFRAQLIRKARKLRNANRSVHGVSKSIRTDWERLVAALSELPSDVHVCPSAQVETASRIVHCIPPSAPFEQMVVARVIFESLKKEEEKEE
jgi:hypothetical protein